MKFKQVFKRRKTAPAAIPDPEESSIDHSTAVTLASRPSEQSQLALTTTTTTLAPPQQQQLVQQHVPQPAPMPNNSRGARTSLNYRPSFHQDNHYHECRCSAGAVVPAAPAADSAGAHGSSPREQAIGENPGFQGLFLAGSHMVLRVAEAYAMSFLTSGAKPLPPGTESEIKAIEEEKAEDEEMKKEEQEEAKEKKKNEKKLIKDAPAVVTA